MKTILRIPTKDQYAFVEVEITEKILEPKEIKGVYDNLVKEFNKTSNISDFDFNNYLIKLVNSDLTEWGHTEFYAELNDSQKGVVQSLKRFFKRLPNNEE